MQNGEDGTSADSKYTWVKYSQNPDGNPLTDSPENAIYIGIAYNMDSPTESNNPLDYSWTKIKGDNGSDAYTIILGNENVTFSVEYGSNNSISDQSYTTSIQVFHGTEEVVDFSIGEVSSNYGITVTKDNSLKTVTLSVSDNETILSDTGSFRIPVNTNGLVFYKDISWNLARQGAPGEQGDSGRGSVNIIVSNESQAIPCDSDGYVSDNTLINIPFMAFLGVDKIPCSVSVGVLPDGITLGEKVDSTTESDGLITLNVSKSSDLGDPNILSGYIDLIFSVDIDYSAYREIYLTDENGNYLLDDSGQYLVPLVEENYQTIYKRFNWTKVRDGVDGNSYTLELSDIVVVKNYDSTLSPPSVTLRSYYQKGLDRVPYEGRFVIKTSGSIDSYISTQNESEYTYVLQEDPDSFVCYLYSADSVTDLLDQQSVTVIKYTDELKPIITEVKSTVTEVSSKVDAVEQKITNKVWQSDITDSINNYDGTTIKSIRDQVAEQTVEIGKITSKVSDVETQLTQKADGSTVEELTEKVSQIEQDAEGFKQTVSETYATKDELTSTTETIQSTIEQTAEQITQTVQGVDEKVSSLQLTADEIKAEVEDARGNTASLSARFDQITSEVETVDGKVSQVQQTADKIQSQVAEKQPIPLSAIRYIRDWLDGNSVDSDNLFVECRVMVDDVNIATGISAVAKDQQGVDLQTQPSNISVYTDDEIIEIGDDGTVNTNTYVNTGTGLQYMQIDLGEVHNDIDYIQVIHYYIDERIYNHKFQISEDGVRWVTLYDSEISGGYTETQDGRTYYISEGYVNDRVSSITQTVNGLTSMVQDNEDNISRLEQTSESFTSQIQQIQDDINNTNQNLQNIDDEIKLNQSEINQTFDEIKMSIAGMNEDMTGIAQSIVQQSAEEWKALFSQIGMGDYPNKNTNVIMSIDGLTVRNPDTGVETVMSPAQFAGYYLGNIVFQLNKDLTITRRIQVDNGVDFTTIKYINKVYTSKTGQKIGTVVHIKSGGNS